MSNVERQHLRRKAYVYVRQSTMAQVERNAESRERQYELVERAVSLGWSAAEVVVVDEDQGQSAKSADGRDGFQRLVAEVGLGRVGIVLGIEVSRLARRNADWYGLLDLCALTDTLIADSDGIYHPGLHNDRLVLGLKGTMSEAELHVLRARLRGGSLHKAAKGELTRRRLQSAHEGSPPRVVGASREASLRAAAVAARRARGQQPPQLAHPVSRQQRPRRRRARRRPRARRPDLDRARRPVGQAHDQARRPAHPAASLDHQPLAAQRMVCRGDGHLPRQR